MLTVEPDPDEEDGETEAAEDGRLDVGAARDEEPWMQRALALSDGVEQLARDSLCMVVRGTARLDMTGKRAGAGRQAQDLVRSKGSKERYLSDELVGL